jgi:hypothetical protein
LPEKAYIVSLNSKENENKITFYRYVADTRRHIGVYTINNVGKRLRRTTI